MQNQIKKEKNQNKIFYFIKFIQNHWKQKKILKGKKKKNPKNLFINHYIRYREERIKNYPTKKNIEKKKELEAKKAERGDLIPKIEKQNKGKKKKNLLNQLIDKEINREKDCILQSLRYIIKNNFYCENNFLSERVKNRLKQLPITEKQKIQKEKKEREEGDEEEEDDLKKKINSIQDEIELLESEEDDDEEGDDQSDDSE